MEHLCVLQLETALATLVTTWFTLADRRRKCRYRSSDQCILNAFRSPERLQRVVQGTTWPAFHFFQVLSNDDGQCLQFSLKKDGKKMENLTIPENSTLVTMDVTSLYTNIPHDDGMAACRKIWEQRTDQEPPTECLVEMLTLVLKNNNFTFDGNHYLQINGTAMGTKMAPSYVNIFMGDLEERLLLSSLKQPLSWFRFIDDVDMKWTHGDKELDEFWNMPTVSIRLQSSHTKCRKPKCPSLILPPRSRRAT